MRFEWDEAKRLANIRKHGIDFVDVPTLFERDTVTVIDDRFDYYETRYLTLGLLKSPRYSRRPHRIQRHDPYHFSKKGNPL